MPKTMDITINLPAEYFDTLSEVIRIGLERAAINPLIRRELKSWWAAEKGLIQDELNNK